MTVHVYTRCMDGHYFEGRTCPTDGHSSAESHAVADALTVLSGHKPDLSQLRAAGVPADIVRRVLIVEEELSDWPPVLPLEITETIN